MIVGELVVKVLLDGAPKAADGLKKVHSGLKTAAKHAWDFKTGIAGTLFALERMTRYSGREGMDLFKFAASTGLASEKLQEWQQIAARFDVSGEEVEGTIRALQQAMLDMQLGRGMPEGFALLGLDPEKTNPFEILTQLVQKSKELQPALFANLASGLKITDNMAQFLRTVDISKEKIDKGLIWTDKERDRLRDIDKKWNLFYQRLRKVRGELVLGFGDPLLKFLTAVTDGIRAASPKIQEGLKVAFTWLEKQFTELAKIWKENDFGTALVLSIEKVIPIISDLLALLFKNLLPKVMDVFTEYFTPSFMKFQGAGATAQSANTAGFSGFIPVSPFSVIPSKESLAIPGAASMNSRYAPDNGANNVNTTFNNTFNLDSNSQSTPKDIAGYLRKQFGAVDRQTPKRN